MDGSGGATAPERIGRYRLVGELGRGAMGRVYVAHDPNVERRVALKVMSAPADGDDEQTHELRQRLLLEARAAGRLSHPGIVAVHDADTDPATGLSFLAMELIEGESLEARLRREGTLPPAVAVDIAARVARALGYAHSRGVVHRDVKPANILLADDGRVKVADFGIAKIGSLAVTRAGLVIGSPYFMSPEQVQGHAVDGRSDLFALGGVLYRCLSGELPFPGEGVVTVAFKVVQVDPRPLDAERLGLPPALLEAVGRALAKRPEERFASGEEMAEALEAVAAGLGSAPPPPPMAEDRPAAAAAPADREQTLVLERATNAFAMPLRATDLPRRRRASSLFGLAGGIAALVALVVLAATLAGSRAPAPPLLGLAAATAARAPESAPGGALPTAVSAPAAGPAVTPAEATSEAAGAGGVRDRPATEPESAARAPVPAAAPAPDSTLDLYYRNRLGSATLTVAVDGQEIWSRPVAAPANWTRLVGDEVVASIPVASGDRRIAVSVVGHSMGVQARGWIVGRFEPGQSLRLRVSLNPYSERVWLEWI